MPVAIPNEEALWPIAIAIVKADRERYFNGGGAIGPRPDGGCSTGDGSVVRLFEGELGKAVSWPVGIAGGATAMGVGIGGGSNCAGIAGATAASTTFTGGCIGVVTGLSAGIAAGVTTTGITGGLLGAGEVAIAC